MTPPRKRVCSGKKNVVAREQIVENMAGYFFDLKILRENSFYFASSSSHNGYYCTGI